MKESSTVTPPFPPGLSQDFTSLNRRSTTDPTIAAGAVRLGLAVQVERHSGVTVYRVSPDDLPADKSLEIVGSVAYSQMTDPREMLSRVRDLEAAAVAEETRKQRQGANASDTPSYTKAELDRLSPEETRLEIHSIESALAAGHISGFKTAPTDPPAEIKFTGTELKSMGPRTMASRLEEVDQALADGAVDWRS
jgi:hypothetical protein